MNSVPVKIILIHGNNGGKDNGGAATDYWFPYAQQEFQRLGFTVIAKDFPDPKVAHRDIWSSFIERQCGADERTILIGHSSGAIAAMRYAEKHRLFGSVLVGAYYTDTGDPNERESGYFDDPWDWESIRKNQQWIIQFASIDDPFFPIEEPRLVSERLHSEYYELKGRGHFFDVKFPELIEVVRGKYFLRNSFPHAVSLQTDRTCFG